MKKITLLLSVTLPLILSACTPPLPQADNESAKGTTSETTSGRAAGGGAGGMTETMVNEYITQQERALEEVFPQSEEAYVQRDENTLMVTLNSDILFDEDSTVLKTDAYDKIHQVAEVVNKYPETSLVVSCHTDSEGSEQHNMSFSEQRSLAVKKALVTDKVAAHRITARGYGESSPLFSNATEHGRQLNRRVTIEIIPIKSR